MPDQDNACDKGDDQGFTPQLAAAHLQVDILLELSTSRCAGSLLE
jgi:hypothetical protein